MKKILLLLPLILAICHPAWAQRAIFYDHVFSSEATGTGNGIPAAVDQYTTVGLRVTITDTATVSFEVSNDGSTWDAIECVSGAGNTESFTSTSGSYQCNVAGKKQFRARRSAYTSGTVTVLGTITTAVFSRRGGGGGSGVASSITGSGTLPAEPCTINQVYGETVGGVSTFYFCGDGTWTEVTPTIATPTLATVCAEGCTYGGAVDSSTSHKVGSTAANVFKETRYDATRGMLSDCVVAGVLGDCDKVERINAGYEFIVEDKDGVPMIQFAPNAGTPNLQYALGTKKAIASILVPLQPRGAASASTESIVSNQPSARYLTVTDSNSDAGDFSFPVTAKMAGATTATYRLVGVSKNASPSGNVDFDCAMTTYTPGTDTFAAHSTTGEVTALLTPATQNRPVAVTTSAHTINGGALVSGDIVFGSCEVDATATTSAQMTDFRLWAYVLIQLSVNSLSD